MVIKRALHLNFLSVRVKWCFHDNQSESQKKKKMTQRQSLIFNLLPGKFLFKFIQLFVTYCGGAFLASEIKLFVTAVYLVSYYNPGIQIG